MKNIRIHFFIIFFIVGGLNMSLKAQVNVTSQTFAEIIEALTASETSQLNFGKFYPTDAGGEVEVTPDGVRLAYGTVTLMGSDHSQAGYQVAGEDAVIYSIILPDGPITLITSNNPGTMTVDNWETIPPAGEGSGLITGGVQQVALGATLHVGSIDNNPVGVYSGEYSITFSYN